MIKSRTEKWIRKITVSWIPVENEMRRKKKMKRGGERRGDEDGKEEKKKRKRKGEEKKMKRSISVLGRNGCCMLLQFAWQLALPLQACMRSPLLAISESYHCGDW